MNCNGKPKGIYEFRKGKEFLASGTIEEICNELSITYSSLHMKVYRTKKGINTKSKYYLVNITDSVNQYLMTINNKFVGEGSLKELSVLSNYSREYLSRIANGNYFKENGKESKIKLYKRVG